MKFILHGVCSTKLRNPQSENSQQEFITYYFPPYKNSLQKSRCKKIQRLFYLMFNLYGTYNYNIWQNPPKRASFWQNIFPFTVLSNPNFPKCSVKNVVLSKHSQKCSVKIRWISVKHWWLYWQCAVLSKSAVMFDRTFLAFDRNPVKS